MIRMCMDCIKEHPAIVKPMYAAMKTVPITHGICTHHFIEGELKRGKSKQQIKQTIDRIRKENPDYVPAPYLKERPDLVKKYKAGVFDEPVVK